MDKEFVLELVTEYNKKQQTGKKRKTLTPGNLASIRMASKRMKAQITPQNVKNRIKNFNKGNPSPSDIQHLVDMYLRCLDIYEFLQNNIRPENGHLTEKEYLKGMEAIDDLITNSLYWIQMYKYSDDPTGYLQNHVYSSYSERKWRDYQEAKKKVIPFINKVKVIIKNHMGPWKIFSLDHDISEGMRTFWKLRYLHQEYREKFGFGNNHYAKTIRVKIRNNNKKNSRGRNLTPLNRSVKSNK
jgi:hypothetical protein